MARWYLRLVAIVFAGFGLLYLFFPAPLASAAGLRPDPSGLTDIRATYGGFQLGFGLFLLWSSGSRTRQASALLATGVVGAMVAAGRLYGLSVDAAPSWFHYVGLVLEISLAACSLLLFRGFAR